MPVGTVGKPEPLLRRLFQAIVGIHQETIAEGHRFRISTVATVSTRPSSISFLPLFSFTVFFELTAAGPVGTVGKPEPLLRRLFQAAVGIHQETIAEGHRFRISTVAAVSTGLPSSGFLRFLNLTRYTFGRRTTFFTATLQQSCAQPQVQSGVRGEQELLPDPGYARLGRVKAGPFYEGR